jgi:hypothetical protein
VAKNRDANPERAEALFNKKEQRERDGHKAMAEYEAEQRATREKTAKLRALRLARDAALKEAPPAAPEKKKRPADAAKSPSEVAD